MGGMFTVVKVREGITSYADPGRYRNPPGTVAHKVADEPRKEKLVPIEGLPPDLVDAPPGCPFQPRCPYAVERCIPENPSLEPVVPGVLQAQSYFVYPKALGTNGRCSTTEGFESEGVFCLA